MLGESNKWVFTACTWLLVEKNMGGRDNNTHVVSKGIVLATMQ